MYSVAMDLWLKGAVATTGPLAVIVAPGAQSCWAVVEWDATANTHSVAAHAEIAAARVLESILWSKVACENKE